MNDNPNSDTLLWAALPDLTLNIAQTAALCGISVRQLGYWTQQGYVDAQGQGARRTYGLDAVRRVLSIRKSMDAGASLRQSLRQISQQPPLIFSLPAPLTRPSSEPMALPFAHVKSLSRSVIAFFEANCHTRDHAGGLAVKLGWSEEDVRIVADKLCADGVLTQEICQGVTIFYRGEWETARA